MKVKKLLITTIAFFVLINTRYFWEGNLGIFAIPATLLLFGIYFGLLIALLRQIYLTIKEKFKDRQRLSIIALLAFILTLTFYKPLGLTLKNLKVTIF